MKMSTGKIITWIFGIFSTIIAGYLLIQLTTERAELEFILSESIPTKLFESSASESVQRLTIINTGELPAVNIQVKINGKISDYSISKHSIEDESSQHKLSKTFEATYGRLPPHSLLYYIITTPGNIIFPKDIELTHSKGKGVDKQAGNNSNIILQITFVIGIIFYFSLISYELFNIFKKYKLTISSFLPYNSALNTKKPFYINQIDWDTERNKYISEQEKVHLLTYNIEEDFSFKVLNGEKPAYMSSEEWEQLSTVSEKRLVKTLSAQLTKCRTIEDLESLLLIEKPKHLPKTIWKKHSEDIFASFFSISRLSGYHNISYKNDVEEQIKKGKPHHMPSAHWEDYLSKLEEKYFSLIIYDIANSSNLWTISPDNFDLSLLSKDRREDVEKFIKAKNLLTLSYPFSSVKAEKILDEAQHIFLDIRDKDELISHSKAVIKIEHDLKECNAIKSTLVRIIDLRSIGERPDTISHNDWCNLLKMEDDIVTASGRIAAKELEIDTENRKTEEMKTRITKQLEFINRTLNNNPDTPSFIEDYDNPFAKGNFENLKKVSKILKERNQSIE